MNNNEENKFGRDYLEGIIQFNRDKSVIALRERYKQPSFFEIISKERSETTYSAFLRWILQLNHQKADEISPVMLLLDVIIQKGAEQRVEQNIADNSFKANLLSRKSKIFRVNATIEKSVSDVAYEIKANEYPTTTSPQLLKEAINSKDRIDIFIEGDIVENGNETKNKLQIIIENKIDSEEGKAKKIKQNYRDYSQTERYYLASNISSIPQFFVFLTSEKKSPQDPHFVNLTYQDILDGVILPLINSTSLSNRDKFFLNEFKKELMFPNLYNFKNRGYIALSEEVSTEISEIWKTHEPLIVDSIVAAINKDNKATFWKFKDHYYNTFPKEQLIKELKNYQESSDLMKESKSTLLNLASKNGIEIQEIKSCFGDNTAVLLESFYHENSNFIMALLSSIRHSEFLKIECFVDYLRKLNRSGRKKYTVYYDEELKGKPNLNNWATVFEIVKCWVENNKKSFSGLSSEAVLEKINKEIPVKENSYYANKRILKNLFYEYKEYGEYVYDGTAIEGQVVTGWDLYKPGAGEDFYISINGTKITMAKMWRTPDVEKFIKSMTKRMGTSHLSVVSSN